MTPEEAIEELQESLDTLREYDIAHSSRLKQALGMAINALSQVPEIKENIIKYMKKYPNHVGNTDFWEGFYACRNVVLQLDDEEYAPKEQEPCDECRNKRTSFCGNCKEYDEFEPCEDAISRDAVINMLDGMIKDRQVYFGHHGDIEYSCGFSTFKWYVEQLPSVTPSRHVNCEIAEHDGNGCLGYSHYGDDFPVKECLHCPKYTSYEEE